MAKSRATRVAEQKRIKEKHGAGSPQHLAAMDRTRAASGKPPKEKKEETKTPSHLVLRKEAEDQIARNQANMRRATVREGLLAEAGVPFPHLTVHDRVASGKGIWETDEERQARATQTARATSMAIAEAGGIKEWNEKIDEIVRETEKKEDPDDGGGKKKRSTVKKEKPIVIKDKDVLEDEDTSRGRVRLTPQMTGGSEYLATDYDRPAFQDWSYLEPPNMPRLLGSAKAQQDLLGSGRAAYQPWAQPAIEYQPPVGPTYATRASLLGSSPAEVAAAVANNQRNNQQLNNPFAVDPNEWTPPLGFDVDQGLLAGGQSPFTQWMRAENQRIQGENARQAEAAANRVAAGTAFNAGRGANQGGPSILDYSQFAFDQGPFTGQLPALPVAPLAFAPLGTPR